MQDLPLRKTGVPPGDTNTKYTGDAEWHISTPDMSDAQQPQ